VGAVEKGRAQKDFVLAVSGHGSIPGIAGSLSGAANPDGVSPFGLRDSRYRSSKNALCISLLAPRRASCPTAPAIVKRGYRPLPSRRFSIPRPLFHPK